MRAPCERLWFRAATHDGVRANRLKLREAPITLPSGIDVTQARVVQPRALGAVRVSVANDDGRRSRLVGLRQSGAFKLVFPRPRGAAIDAVLVNTAGGLTGGDRFEFHASVGAGAALCVTTQAAERAYRAQLGEVARVLTRLEAGAGARLFWLPQEMILFDRAALHRRLNVDLAADTRFLMVESLVFGRAAMGEVLAGGDLIDRIAIQRDGRPAYLDGLRLSGDIAAHMARPAVGAGAGAMASLVYIAPDAGARLATVRAHLGPTAGASLIGEDMLVLRALAPDSFFLRRMLLPVLDDLTDKTLPICWRL